MSLANRTIDLASKQVLVAADGTAAAPSITNDGDTNTGMFFPAADTIAFSEGGTESMRIDSSGRVGIGTTQMTSSGADLHIFRASGATVRLDRTGAGTCTIQSAETGVSLRDLTLDANTLLLNTANTERLRIDSSGNVGIGTTSPQNILHISSSGPVIRIQDNDTVGNGTNSIATWFSFRDSAGSQTGYFGFPSDPNFYIWNQTNSAMVFGTNHTERLRITSGGDLLVGTTTSNGKTTILGGSDVPVMSAQATNASYSSNVLSLFADRNTSNSSYNFLVCTRTGVAVVFALRDSGNVVNTNNSYGAISDIKLKENIENASSQWNDIKSIQVRKFSFKNDEEHKRMLGLVAQEVELISPHLVETVIDRDKDGNDLGTTTKEVKYSVLYMKAVKALQEAMERIEQLESKVAALEAA